MLSPGQQAFARAIVSDEPQDRNLIVLVHRRGGKTEAFGIGLATRFRINPKQHWFHLAGSYLQASRLYEVWLPLVTNPELFPDMLIGEPTKFLTKFREGGSLEVITASSKAARGPVYADGVSFDEAVLIPMKLINAAWPMIRAAEKPKRVITSTASDEVNYDWFVDCWQNAARKRLKPFSWPQSECHWLNVQDAEDAALILDRDTYIVEYEGGVRPRTGAVWGDLVDGMFVNPKSETWPKMAADPLTDKFSALDWGYVGMAVFGFFEAQGDKAILRDLRIWTKESYSQIKQEIFNDYGKYPIYPDSEAASDNDDLVKMGMEVMPVVFSKYKIPLISRVRWRLENSRILAPDPDHVTDPQFSENLFTLKSQMKAYKFNPATGKPIKKNDHCCDMMICAMMKFFEDENRSPLRLHHATRGERSDDQE